MNLFNKPGARLALVIILALLVGGGSLLIANFGAVEEDAPVFRPDEQGKDLGAGDRRFDTLHPLERACDLGDKLLLRTWRGWHPERSEEILFVPQHPNFSGSFSVPNHSGPWDYLQIVPFVWYGPGRVKAQGRLDAVAEQIDTYPSLGKLLKVDLPERRGRVLKEALVDAPGAPKVVVVVVWDGVGRNVLELWPDAWPNLAELERKGTSFLRGSVGSSPSITPATHANLGTGTYPIDHGVPGITYRSSEGPTAEAFQGRDPRLLLTTTFGDDIDRAFGNRSLVGMLAWRSWHLGMLSHGTALDGGDADLLGLVGEGESVGGPGIITGNDDFFYTPGYLPGFPGLDEYQTELDEADGETDGLWRGHDIRDLHDNPSWVWFQRDALLEILRREGFGSDDIPDVFTTNFKMSDIVGHQYGIETPEMEEVLRAQDEALGDLVELLDEEVGDYVVIVTADHGHTPKPATSGGWPVAKGPLKQDIDAEFAEGGASVVEKVTAVGIFMNLERMDELGVTHDDVARFLNDYTIADNWDQEELPPGFEERGEDHMFSAAFPGVLLPEVNRCRFGSATPPKDLRG